MITLMLGQPDVARARPSTLLNRPSGYDQVFPEALPIPAYLTAIEILKAVDEYLKSAAAKEILDEFSNTRFYVAVGYEILALNLKKISNLHFDKAYHNLTIPLDTDKLGKALTVLAKAAEAYQTKHPKASRDSIFKSSEFCDEYFAALLS
jgi:hypothetical protein